MRHSIERSERLSDPIDTIKELIKWTKELSADILDELLIKESISMLQEYFYRADTMKELFELKGLMYQKLLLYRTRYHEKVATLFNQIDPYVMMDSLEQDDTIQYSLATVAWKEQAFAAIRSRQDLYKLHKDTILVYLQESGEYFQRVSDTIDDLVVRQKENLLDRSVWSIPELAKKNGNIWITHHTNPEISNLVKDFDLFSIFEFSWLNPDSKIDTYLRSLQSATKISSYSFEYDDQTTPRLYRYKITTKSGIPFSIEMSYPITDVPFSEHWPHRVMDPKLPVLKEDIVSPDDIQWKPQNSNNGLTRFGNNTPFDKYLDLIQLYDEWVARLLTEYFNFIMSFDGFIGSGYRTIDIKCLDPENYFSINTVLPLDIADQRNLPEKPLITPPSYSYRSSPTRSPNFAVFLYDDEDRNRTEFDEPSSNARPIHTPEELAGYIRETYAFHDPETYQFRELEISWDLRQEVLRDLQDELSEWMYEKLFEPTIRRDDNGEEVMYPANIRMTDVGGPTIIRIRKTKPSV